MGAMYATWLKNQIISVVKMKREYFHPPFCWSTAKKGNFSYGRSLNKKYCILLCAAQKILQLINFHCILLGAADIITFDYDFTKQTLTAIKINKTQL